MTTTHPTDRELGDFLLGKLDDESLVESHLAECDSCRDRAAGIDADDTFTELLASARTRLDSIRASAPTPTLDGASTPPAFAPTLAWETPGADPTGLTVPVPLANHPKYRPIRRLGIGGMGTVWLAEHTVMHRPVAVKVIRPDLLARPGATGRFLREVRAAAKLHHPNIVTAFDAEPTGDSCLFVMEYVPGETLAERLGSGPLPLLEALKAGRDAARGLAHAHSHGLVHRDVKPHNLIRAGDGTTKVLDFGLAGVGAGEAIAANGDGLTGAGMVVGTPDYIAPEQIADPHTADARADIYGLGCTLYHLLAGRSPVPDGSVMEKLTAQRERPMDPIPGLPAAVATVLTKMTAKDPKDRYQSADEVVAALERCIRMVEPVMRKRRRVMAVAAAISLALFLMISAVMYKLLRDNEVIEIKTNDPDIEVLMKRKGEVVKIIDHKSHQEWTYDTLKNEIAQAETADGLTLQLPANQAVVLKRNGKDVFSVKRITTVAGPAKPEASPTPTPGFVQRIDNRNPVRTIAFAPDGKSIVAVGDGLRRYDLATGKSIFESRFATDGPTQLAVSGDGQMAVVASTDKVRWYSLGDGHYSGFLHYMPAKDSKAVPITAVALAPDGQTVAFATGESLHFGGAKASEPKQVKLQAPGLVIGLRYSPLGGVLVAAAARPDGSRTQLIVLDAQTHQVVGRHDVAGMLGNLHIAGDGKRLVAAGGAGNTGRFTVRTLPDLKLIVPETDVAGFVDAARLSADGKRLTLERAPGAVEVWDVDRKERMSDQALPADPKAKAGDAPVRHVAIAPDGRSVAVARGNEIGVWELPTAPKTRNPFGVPDVEDPDGGEVQALAAQSKLTGGPDDPNAEKWVTLSTAGTADSIDGEWYGRWKLGETEWVYDKETARVKTVGDRVYILYTDSDDTFLADLRRDGDRLIGRTQAVHQREISIACVLRIVGPDRLDGEIRLTGGLRGRQDFRRKLAGQAGKAADRTAAEYVLSIGGSVRVNDRETDIKAAGELPKDPFRLTHVMLTGNPKVTDTGLSVFNDCPNLILLYLGKTAVTDAGLAHFRGCWNINDLELEDTQVTDAGLAHFRDCPALRHLDLDGCTHVTDAGLAHFKGCKKLRDLYLFDTGVTDAGLAPFADCASLEIIGFGETRVGDAGLAHLKDCKRLTHLMVNSSQLTDRGLEVVAGYKDLRTLTLQATKVTDAGVKHLKPCGQLVVLDLGATALTDAGLKSLAGLTKLEQLHLQQTKVTAAGVTDLAKALPKCRIEWDGGAIGPPPKGK